MDDRSPSACSFRKPCRAPFEAGSLFVLCLHLIPSVRLSEKHSLLSVALFHPSWEIYR